MHAIEDVLAPAVVRSSRDRAWPGIEVMRSRNPLDALDVDGLQFHTLALNVGRPYRLEGRVAGRKVNSTMPLRRRFSASRHPGIDIARGGPCYFVGRAAYDSIGSTLRSVAAPVIVMAPH